MGKIDMVLGNGIAPVTAPMNGGNNDIAGLFQGIDLLLDQPNRTGCHIWQQVHARFIRLRRPPGWGNTWSIPRPIMTSPAMNRVML